MKTTMLGVADRITRGIGVQLIPEWRLERLAIASHLRSLFDHCGIRTVLDVGANRGQYHDFLRQEVGFEGTVHSFEPIAGLVEAMLQRQSEDAAWHIHHCALGDEAGVATIGVAQSDTLSSLKGLAERAPSAFVASATVVREESITIATLDDFVARHAIDLLTTYLKVDTQGFDMEVLAGGPNAVQALPAMQLELAIQQIYAGVAPYRDVLVTLESLGMAISGLFPISCDAQLKAVEFDCILVRSEQAAR